MPCGDDDDDSSSSSLQRQKLLESEASSSPSTPSGLTPRPLLPATPLLLHAGAGTDTRPAPPTPGTPRSARLGRHGSTPSLPVSNISTPQSRRRGDRSPSPLVFDGPEPLPAGVDPDRCYSWLLPPPPRPRPGSDDSNLSSVSSSSRSSLPVPPPPDGGWGWLVVLGAFTVSLICDGLSYCFGVLYSELLLQFGESRSKTSMVGSIFFGVAMILGPLASALTTRFGCRKMTVFGGLLSSLGFLLSYFATSVDMLCFTFSVVVGAGFSFCYITSVVIVAFYFDRRRALATGLAVCGTGVGTFTFAPLMDYLISEYGWRGLFLIMSALSLNLVVCGMLFRPLQFTEAQRCQMLLEEFDRIRPSREELETARGAGRYNSSESADSESSSGSSGPEGCWGRGRAGSTSSSDSEDEADPRGGVKALSVLSLPTFVRSTGLAGHSSPSVVLMEALRGSNNPHLTMQRYMTNAFLQMEHARLSARQARERRRHKRHLSERVSASSPVDSEAYSVSRFSSSRQEEQGKDVSSRATPRTSLRVSPVLIRHSRGTSPAGSPALHRHSQRLNSADAAMTFSHPRNKPVHIADPGILCSTPTDDLVTLKNQIRMEHPALPKDASVVDIAELKPVSKGKNSHRDLARSSRHHLEYSGMSSALLDRPGGDGSKRLSGFYVGRHNALSIHLPLYRTDIFYRRAVLLRTDANTADQRHQQSPPPACTLGTSCPELADPPAGAAASQPGHRRACWRVSAFLEDAGEVLRSMVEFRLFLNPFFALFVASNFIYYFWSDVPYMYAADHSVEQLGVDTTSASFILSIIGIFNTVGQVIFGYIGDLDVNLLNIYAVVSALAGVFVAVVPFVRSYVALSAVYAGFGFCISVSFPLTTVLLVNYLGVARLTNAYGLLMLMQGIANLFGPPFAGWVSDTMQSYDPAFLLSGFFYGLSGLVLFLAYLPACRRFEAARSRRTSLDTSSGAATDTVKTSVIRIQHLREEGSPV